MTNLAQAGVGLSAFELDLFGRLRAQSESAFQTWLAAEEGTRAARIVLSATVADAYVATLAAREREALIQATVEDRQASERLTRQLLEAGQADASEMAAAEAQVRTAEADLEAARRDAAVAGNALVLAVGRPLTGELATVRGLDISPVETLLPVGAPSDLLTRRPEIRQAERSLLAARANVTAARRAFFPTISLTGQSGYASPDLDDLFDGPELWSFTPQISVPIFQGGRLQSQLDLAAVRQNAAVARYELAIQRAFAEVSDGLAARQTFDRQIAAQNAAVEASARRASLAEARYRAGVSSRLDLLDAQRQLYAAASISFPPARRKSQRVLRCIAPWAAAPEARRLWRDEKVLTDAQPDDHGSRSADRTRSRILVTASDLFGINGFHETTIRAIGGAAAVDPAMVSRHFGGKDELFAAAFGHELTVGLVGETSTDGEALIDERALRRFTRLLVASAFAPASVKTLCTDAVTTVLSRSSTDCSHRWRTWADEPTTLQCTLELFHALHPSDPSEPLARALCGLVSRRARHFSRLV
ncbi:MAG: efflux transporter outer membrane subunit [Brevundimonas sp.]|nr:efflux transporter outer membrane subunit [Brevundimonas sp.]